MIRFYCDAQAIGGSFFLPIHVIEDFGLWNGDELEVVVAGLQQCPLEGLLRALYDLLRALKHDLVVDS
jgi:hypothetical protein